MEEIKNAVWKNKTQRTRTNRWEAKLAIYLLEQERKS